MEKIVIERFIDGQMYVTDTIEIGHRLLNEDDLDGIVTEDADLSFVRNQQNTTHGYYKDADGLWTFGDYNDALNEIKRRV